MKNTHTPYGPYERFLKRPLDFIVSLCALIILSPLLLILTVTGTVAMKGNPFFVQRRPGRRNRDTGKEKIFSMIKFRTMTNEKDKDGILLPDEKRLNKYGKVLRSTSFDELPELINILKGDMSIVGPRPLMVEYLPYYTEKERHRHDARPGLTGLAQVNGRSFISWEETFSYDIQYVNKITFKGDLVIIAKTVQKVLRRENIADPSASRIDENGRMHFTKNGEDVLLHQTLDKERQGMKNDDA